MKTLRLLLSCTLAFMVVLACSDDEDVLLPDDPNGEITDEDGEHSDEWYAERAKISSEDPYFTANADGGTFLIKTSGHDAVITVDCGTEWNSNISGTASWLSVEESRTELLISVAETTETDDRSAEIELATANEGILFATLQITQHGLNDLEITVDENTWNAPAVGTLTTEIAVNSPTGKFNFVNPNSWLNVEKTNKSITITADENEDTEWRQGTVTVTCESGDKTDSEVITVIQDGKVFITLSDEFLTFSFDEDSRVIGVESNFEWTATTDQKYSWLSLTNHPEELVVDVAYNGDEEKRGATLTFSAGDGAENTIEVDVSVNQAGAVFTLEYTITTPYTTVKLPLNGTVNCAIDWGDGSEEETCTSATPSHTYTQAGVYNVAIYGTATELSHVGITVSAASDNSVTANTALTAVKSWGSIQPTTFAAAFSGCTALKTLPKTTGSALSKPGSFARAFYYCESLEAIPDDLFAESTELSSLERTFMYCSSLEEIPRGLLDNCPKLKVFTNAFRNCGKIKKIPAGLLDTAGETLTDAAYVFCDSGLEEYPDSLFIKCPNITTVRAFFYNSNITKIPKGLFENLSKITGQHDYIFAGTKITEVPEGLFDSFSKATILAHTFHNCTELVSVPTSLFDYATSCTDFSYCFYNCSKLEGESPYYMDGDTKVHLYERDNVATYTNCFYNCTLLDDYSTIPSDWK